MKVAALPRRYAAAPGPAIPLPGVCERERPCPALQVPTSPRAGARGDAQGSGSRVPRGSSMCNPAGLDCQDGEAGTGHLPAARSSLQAVTYHPRVSQQARE